MTSARPSPLKSPTRTLIREPVYHVIHRAVLNFVPSESPTHSPRGSIPLTGTSNFMTSMRPSPLKSPAKTFICKSVSQVSQRVILSFVPSESPTHTPDLLVPLAGTSIIMMSVRPSPLNSPARTFICELVFHVAQRAILNLIPSESPTHSPRCFVPLAGTSTFMTSVRPSPLKSPARTFICELASQVAQRKLLNFVPSESPTHSAPWIVPLAGASKSMTSVRPSPLTSPARTFIREWIFQVAQRVILNFVPSEVPTHSPCRTVPPEGTSNFMTSVRPSPLKSPASPNIVRPVDHRPHCSALKPIFFEMPVQMP